MKVKIDNTCIGDFAYDNITVVLDGVSTQICFDKEENISQYDGKYVDLNFVDGNYVITNLAAK